MGKQTNVTAEMVDAARLQIELNGADDLPIDEYTRWLAEFDMTQSPSRNGQMPAPRDLRLDDGSPPQHP